MIKNPNMDTDSNTCKSTNNHPSESPIINEHYPEITRPTWRINDDDRDDDSEFIIPETTSNMSDVKLI